MKYLYPRTDFKILTQENAYDIVFRVTYFDGPTKQKVESAVKEFNVKTTKPENSLFSNNNVSVNKSEYVFVNRNLSIGSAQKTAAITNSKFRCHFRVVVDMKSIEGWKVLNDDCVNGTSDNFGYLLFLESQKIDF